MMNRNACSLLLCLACGIAFDCGPAPQTPNPPANTNTAPISSTGAPAPLTVFKVEWSDDHIPSEMQAGKEYNVTATIKNTGNQPWPSKALPGTAANQVVVSYHWLPENGTKPVVFEGARTPLPHDVAPGESLTLKDIHVLAPSGPGSYKLQITLLQELVAWFDQQGADTIIVSVKVK